MSHPVPAAVAALLARTSIFRMPAWQPESAWHMHVPFAFLAMDMLRPRLVVELGTQKGASYCAFCEGAVAFETGSRLFAVDHWDGDHQTGAYARDTYDVLRAYHDPLYGHMSSLLRQSFEDALPRFEDGTIDLLHIDGLHTYEAVRHDFETWLPKMSSSGVILMHDTEERKDDFGVWRLWAELEKRYPTLNFPFCSGLGVVLVGENAPADLRALCQLPVEDKQVLYRLFEALGGRVELNHLHDVAAGKARDYLAQSLHMQQVHEGYKAGAEEQIDAAMKLYRQALQAANEASGVKADPAPQPMAPLAPVSAPVQAQVSAPVQAPVSAPVQAPVSSPVQAPVNSTLKLYERQPGSRVAFRCNCCGTHNLCDSEKIGREISSCAACGSSVRMRSVVHLLSTALFGRSLAIPDMPMDKAIVGRGLTDWFGYADRLEEKFDYLNTYYHQEPRLDIENVQPEMQACADFLISTDVFEHTLWPVEKAFRGAYEVLKPGGWLILTVPFTLEDRTVEHYPRVRDLEITSLAGEYLVVAKTSEGEIQLHRNPVFHGGAGHTLEMRVFSRNDIEDNLRKAGFSDIRMLEESEPEFGVLLTEPWSLPFLARKPL